VFDDDSRACPQGLCVSPKSPSRQQTGKHLDSLRPFEKEIAIRYLRENGFGKGSFEFVEVEKGYTTKDNELWWCKTDKKETNGGLGARVKDEPTSGWWIMRLKKRGVSTCHQTRFKVNAMYMAEAEKTLPVNHIYAAGAEGSLDDDVEFGLENRLMSYHKIHKLDSIGGRAFLRQCEHLRSQA